MPVRPATPETRAANITVLPDGQTLPESFLTQDWSSSQERWRLPSCLHLASAKCEAILADLDGD